MKNIAVFASGTGTNAAKIIEHFKLHPAAKVSLVVCNKPGAGVTQVAALAGVPVLMIEKDRFFRGDAYLPELLNYSIDFIVLAGFLWKVPAELVKAYPSKIINIHPALLPKYGGKGMFGNKVHEAVIAAGETQSGISIHFVNEIYDDGETILQVSCPVLPGDTPELLADRIHQLEHRHYPEVIEKLVNGKSF
jgi:phosphoribosylglycinamide formyltransferase-1